MLTKTLCAVVLILLFRRTLSLPTYTPGTPLWPTELTEDAEVDAYTEGLGEYAITTESEGEADGNNDGSRHRKIHPGSGNTFEDVTQEADMLESGDDIDRNLNSSDRDYGLHVEDSRVHETLLTNTKAASHVLLPKNRPPFLMLGRSDAATQKPKPPMDEVFYSSHKQQKLPLRMGDFRQDWCKGTVFEQEISVDDCQPVVVRNRLCFGQCGSFFVPRVHAQDFVSASACMPLETEVTTIVLKCPALYPPYREQQVRIVKECGCRPVT